MPDQHPQPTGLTEEQLNERAFNIFEGVKMWFSNAPDAELIQISVVSAMAAAYKNANKPFTAEHVEAVKNWVADMQQMLDMSALALNSFLCVNVKDGEVEFTLSPEGEVAFQKTMDKNANTNTPANV